MYLAEINSNGSVARPLELKLTGALPIKPQVMFWADYQGKAADKLSRTSATQALGLSVGAVPDQDDIELTTSTSFTSLQENSTGRILLTIDNKTGEKLDFTVSNPVQPDYIKMENEGDAKISVPPQSTATKAFKISADEEVKPGKYPGVFEVSAETGCSIPIRRSISYEVTLEVLGQSELLTLFGIPSLLFLPGYLMLALWLFLWRFKALRITWLVKAGSSDEFFFGLKDAEFWLLGITISLLLYFSRMPLLFIENVQAYSLTDIATLWIASLTISLVTYLVLLKINRWRLRVAAETLAATTLTRADSVISALEKIILRKWDIRNSRPVRSKPGVTPERKGFLLWRAEEADSTWLMPQIIVSGKRDDIGDVDPAEQGIDSATLRDRIEQVAKISGVQVRWAEMPGLDGPVVVNNGELDDNAPADLVWMDYI
jgi:hypothetical protein